MNKITLSIFLIFFTLTGFAQDDITNGLKMLIDNKQYDKVIAQYSKTEVYPAKALYYIGLSYYMKEDDNNCLKFMDLSIDKDPEYAPAYYIKASTLNYMKNYNDAVKSFQLAIKLDPADGESYSGLGDSYYDLEKNDLALEAYKTSTEQKNAPDRAFARIGQIYAEQKQNDKSLAAYYVAKSKISTASESYINVLYNIGLFELMNENYDKAELAYAELIQLSPDDFQSYAKMIQIYYAKKEYDKADTYKKKLYEASKNGLLKGTLKDKFCFDQFKWNGKLIEVFERFENGTTDDIYIKHLFYVVNQDNDIEFKIQTEYSPISVEQGGPKYLLCMTKGNMHSTFNIGFNDNFKYDDLKKSVIDILEEKIKPTATSQPGK